MKKILTYVILIFGYQLMAQSIQKFSIDNGGGSFNSGNIEVLYTIGEVNVQELEVANLVVSEGFINTDFKIKINPKMVLQGPSLNAITEGLMNDTLRELGFLPTTSPYADALTTNANVFNLGGISGIGLPENDIVDWVWLEIRQANDNTKIVNARSALLQRDGDVVDVDGLSTLLLNAAPNQYYVVVKHRNHLSVMGATAVALQESTVTLVDFSNNSFSTFGNNAQVFLGSGKAALWTGDTNASRSIVFSGTNNDVNSIKDFILADPANVLNFITFSSSGYLLQDVDLDGIARFSGPFNDSNIIKDNILGHPGNVLNFPTFTIGTTVPPEN